MWKFDIFVVFFVLTSQLQQGTNGQFPNFLSALYGGGGEATTTKRPLMSSIRPPVRPPPPIRPRIDTRQSLDDALSIPAVAVTPNSNNIITAPSNIPVSNTLLNNYVVQNNGPNLANLGPTGGVINTPNSFPSSPSVRKLDHSKHLSAVHLQGNLITFIF